MLSPSLPLDLSTDSGYRGKIDTSSLVNNTSSKSLFTNADTTQLTTFAIGQGSSAIANVFNYIGNYKAAKSNYKTTINNANELIDQTNRQVALLQKQ